MANSSKSTAVSDLIKFRDWLLLTQETSVSVIIETLNKLIETGEITKVNVVMVNKFVKAEEYSNFILKHLANGFAHD